MQYHCVNLICLMDKASALKILKDNGYKLTRSRDQILEVLLASDSPMNPYEIVESAKSKDINLDVVTVYRALKVLKELEIVHFLKGESKYLICEEPCEDHCHHQFICDDCGQVDDLHLNDSNLIESISNSYPALTIKSHYFEFSGICNKCK